MNQQQHQLVSENIALLEQSGAKEDKQGKRLLESLLKCTSEPSDDLQAQAIQWLNKHGNAAVAPKTLELGLRLARKMKNDQRKEYDEKVFHTLFNWCSKVLSPGNVDVLLFARILGDRADDEYDWEGSHRWFLRLVEAASQYQICREDADLRALLSHALRGLAGLALRNKEYDAARDYAQQDRDLFEGIEVGAERELAFSLGNLADIAMQMGRESEAKELRARQMRIVRSLAS